MIHSWTERRKCFGVRCIRWILFALVVVVMATTMAVLLWVYNLGRSFDSKTADLGTVFQVQRKEPVRVGPQTILLLVSDSRTDLGADRHGEDVSRSDTIMVVHLPKDHAEIYIMSVLRDSWVQIPGCGEEKINSASAIGGVPLAVETVENLIGVQIDHVAMVDFEGFKGMTDALGGVTVSNTNEFTAGGFAFSEGQITLGGEEALAFVRDRNSLADGEHQRVHNQQAYLQALLRQTISAETLTNPGKLEAVVSAISPYLTVDSGFDAFYVRGLAPSMVGISATDIHIFTAPTLGAGTSDSGQSIVVVDEAEMATLRQAFQDDALDEYLALEDRAG